MDWYTNISFDNQYFIIERSENGNDFYPIETVTNISNTQLTHYELIDRTPSIDRNQYRVTVIDTIRGDYLSNVVEENISAIKQFTVYPNPAYKNLFILSLIHI